MWRGCLPSWLSWTNDAPKPVNNESVLWVRLHELSADASKGPHTNNGLMILQQRILSVLQDLARLANYSPQRMQRLIYDRGITNIHLYAAPVPPGRVARNVFNFAKHYMLAVFIGTQEAFIGHDTVNLDACGFDCGPQ